MTHGKSLLLACATVAVLLVDVSAASAQGRGCEWLPGTRNITSRMVGANRVSYASTPRIRCSDGRFIQADSALQFQASGYMEFIGRVVFRDDGRTLNASRAVYYENLGRLDAEGDVTLVEADGNEIRGERLLFLRESPQRPREELTVTGGRPVALLYPSRETPADTVVADSAGPLPDSTATAADSAGAATPVPEETPEAPAAPPVPDTVPRAPYEIVADRIFLRGSEVFTARGDVEVQRDSLRATADSLAYDQQSAALNLNGRPATVVQGELDLQGRSLRIVLPGDVIEEVVARDDALLTTDSLIVDAPFIRLFLSDGLLDRLVAAAPRAAEPDSPGPDSVATDSLPRAVATGNGIVMTADSLEVVSPAQKLERMIAIGTARAVSTTRDSLNAADTPELLLHDWIEGQTVTAIFAEQPSSDSEEANSYTLETLEASGQARSLYRLDPDSAQLADTTAYRSRLPISYVEADGIFLTFREGQVSRFRYEGLRRGQQLQPVRRPDEVGAPDTNGQGEVPPR